MHPLRRYFVNFAFFAAANAVALYIMFRLGVSPQALCGIQGAGMIFGSISPTLTEKLLQNSELMTKVRAKSHRYALPSWLRLSEQLTFGVIGLALLAWAIWPRQ